MIVLDTFCVYLCMGGWGWGLDATVHPSATIMLPRVTCFLTCEEHRLGWQLFLPQIFFQDQFPKVKFYVWPLKSHSMLCMRKNGNFSWMPSEHFIFVWLILLCIENWLNMNVMSVSRVSTTFAAAGSFFGYHICPLSPSKIFLYSYKKFFFSKIKPGQ